MKIKLRKIRSLIQKDWDSGLTQVEIAEKIGVAQGTIFKYLDSFLTH